MKFDWRLKGAEFQAFLAALFPLCGTHCAHQPDRNWEIPNALTAYPMASSSFTVTGEEFLCLPSLWKKA